MNTTYFLNCVAGNIFKTKTAPAIPTQYYIGLSTTTPNLNGSGVTEPSASAGYSRVLLSNLSAPTNGLITNLSSISFNESTSQWGRITHYVIYDSKTGGNLLIYDELSPPQTIDAKNALYIKEGTLKLRTKNPD